MRKRTMNPVHGADCAVAACAELIGSKWTAVILHDLSEGPRRFTELEHACSGISPRTLADRLRTLEQADILDRRSYHELPPRVEYELTTRGARCFRSSEKCAASAAAGSFPAKRTMRTSRWQFRTHNRPRGGADAWATRLTQRTSDAVGDVYATTGTRRRRNAVTNVPTTIISSFPTKFPAQEHC